jgi:adenine-specific DNA-methyltransferase
MSSKKVAYDFIMNNKLNEKRSESDKAFISDITIERVNRAGVNSLKEIDILTNKLDVGYKVFSLVDKPKVVENKTNGQMEISYTRTPQNTLYNMMCSKSVKLNAEIEEIIKDKLYRVNGDYYVLALCDYEQFCDCEKNVYIDGYIFTDDKSIIEFIENIKSQVKDDDKVEVIY